ncbi:MAG: B-glycosyltransferase, glycosyltransferase family 2 protein [Candidatus Daviesbacteria bacterium GW2011_GWB1_39_5]|uniref:B-glycosyltransferase, glycosyltransferase family 2 protein n=1 Tax=Candidatus Daviesbacteria bacterium GW2011_GWC2_40_12 TaxID=1618431 RepID=A0A0G0QYB4_9BACT|nr:MAG: B-glycosyltransferase, glycosyltransferase family 2 protein [Candidatus Daviesbacteria bacterium GW2011_GWA2_39_33]KKR23894.1 MAG: B-glycosyltransferase, glycosyltransferase family 2 protein [Candidatus Daviesbacteria bacterium GW2011_GWB1_39_5]KKR42441.1 MAG: B-glycosyltransferase, glycosyltransferase family 2 protein [Candidatus Daviesbacteria bacterium GW2011_GWC2_40_12]HCE31192.1 hypothetical protein [Candidatus Daviesbacteria bacterium]
MPEIEKLKIVIVMPAYNAAKTVRNTYLEIPPYLRENIILVDDGSKDNTVQIAKELGIKVIEHSKNVGYGGNQKTCYAEALKLDPDIVVMLHPDYQYDASMIEDLVYPIARGRYDFMFGSRIANKKGALAGGMPPLKYYVNRFVCLIQNILLGVNFTEHFSGLRAYSKKLLQTVPWQNFSNDFVFDQEMTISALAHGFTISEVAIPTRYHEKASSIGFIRGTKFILEGFLVITALYLHKLNLIQDKRFEPVKSTNIGKYFIALPVIIFINLFLYGIFQKDLLFGLFLFAESVLIYFSFVSRAFFIRLLACMVLVFLILISFYKDFDRTFFYPTQLEISTQAFRHEYFALELGKLYKNRIGITYMQSALPLASKFNRNMFSHLAFDSLLNAQSILSLISIPLFLLGIYKLPRLLSRGFLYSEFTIFYLSVVFAAGGFLTFEGQYGLLLYAPIVNFLIYLGLLQAIHKIFYAKA